MFRRFINRKKDYYYKNLYITKRSLVEESAIGRWSMYDDTIKMFYISSDDRDITYGDLNFLIYKNNYLIGYLFYSVDVLLTCNDYFKIGSRKINIIDYAIDDRAYVRVSVDFFRFFIKNFLVDKDIDFISISKKQNNDVFYKMIRNNFKCFEDKDNIYIEIKKKRTCLKLKYLMPLKDDRIMLEHLYYLYGLGFKILKTKCVLKLNNEEKIEIYRRSGKIIFPSNVKNEISGDVYLNGYNIHLIHYLTYMYKCGRIEAVRLNVRIHDKDNTLFDIIDDMVIAYESSNNVRKNINFYLKALKYLSINKVSTIYVNYEVENSSYCTSNAIFDLTKMMKSLNLTLDDIE